MWQIVVALGPEQEIVTDSAVIATVLRYTRESVWVFGKQGKSLSIVIGGLQGRLTVNLEWSRWREYGRETRGEAGRSWD